MENRYPKFYSEMEFLEEFSGSYSTLQLPLQQPPSLSSGPKVGISSLNGSVTLRAGHLNSLGGCERDSSRAWLKFSGMKAFQAWLYAPWGSITTPTVLSSPHVLLQSAAH